MERREAVRIPYSSSSSQLEKGVRVEGVKE